MLAQQFKQKEHSGFDVCVEPYKHLKPAKPRIRHRRAQLDRSRVAGFGPIMYPCHCHRRFSSPLMGLSMELCTGCGGGRRY